MSGRNWLVVTVALLLVAAAMYLRQTPSAPPSPAPPAAASVTETRQLMGTLATVTVMYVPGEGDPRKAVGDAFAEMTRLAALWNKYNADSEVGKLNTAGTNPIVVSPETAQIIKWAQRFSELSSGAFDISIEPVLRMWKRCAGEDRLPTDKELGDALLLVGYRDILVEEKAEPAGVAGGGEKKATIRFARDGMAIDLGGIAQGVAADLAAAKLAASGVKSALIDIGGDIRALGGKLGQGDWVIAVRDPRDAAKFVAKLRMNGNAVTTSGDYERFLVIGGTKVNHIIDARTGGSANLCASVTIIAPTGCDADALATTVFVLGPDDGMKLVESLPDVEALIIDPSGKAHRSSGFAKHEQQ
ncbi:MAG: FAD:protein FMN transferase [Planctomycetota bacterium]|nr:FAD:protein FMN transferase [Planctomycetota bacterium]